nr:transposase [Paenibacillus sp. V4I5]
MFGVKPSRSTERHYRCVSCEGCPLKPQCTKAAGQREVKVSMKYLCLKTSHVRSPAAKKASGSKRFLLRSLPK